MKTYRPVTPAIVAVVSILSIGQFAAAEVSQEELESISTPDKVKTSLGELKFFDGIPTDETVQKVYDNKSNQVAIFSQLLDSKASI